MSSESPSQRPTPEAAYSYDDGTGKVSRYSLSNSGELIAEAETYRYSVEPRASPVAFEHDKQKRLFILKWPDGKTERFRDNPARQLMVEPDPRTGEMRPVIKGGEPVYVYLCREEREVT